MKMLTGCELVHARKDGVWMKYQLNEEKVVELKEFINYILSNKAKCVCKREKTIE